MENKKKSFELEVIKFNEKIEFLKKSNLNKVSIIDLLEIKDITKNCLLFLKQEYSNLETIFKDDIYFNEKNINLLKNIGNEIIENIDDTLINNIENNLYKEFNNQFEKFINLITISELYLEKEINEEFLEDHNEEIKNLLDNHSQEIIDGYANKTNLSYWDCQKINKIIIHNYENFKSNNNEDKTINDDLNLDKILSKFDELMQKENSFEKEGPEDSLTYINSYYKDFIKEKHEIEFNN